MKRCSKCGKIYDDVWQVCLQDGEPLISVEQGYKFSHPKSIKFTKTEEEILAIKIYWAIVICTAVFVYLMIMIFDGNPFINPSIQSLQKYTPYEAFMYNIGVSTGTFLIGIIVAIPMWLLWKIKH
jgi:uncharacterized membrane protein YvbJ